jgi:hypothetical protein
VLIAAVDPQRAAALAQGLRDLGHFVVRNSGEASVVLADSAPPQGKLPAVTLGFHNPPSRGRLPRDATLAQIDAALRALSACGWKLRMRGRVLKPLMKPSNASC